MKNSLTLIALAAGVSQVSATFGFHNAPSFSCPDNTDNVCQPDMNGGFDWSDLNFGGFDSYKGFKWSGFSCSQKFGKRDELTKRTFQSKCITGTAGSSKDSSPKISCDKGAGGPDKTSITEFQVTPEFDCDLEFHYSMPDGSTCKHRSACKSSGTTVQNSQCGGATDVTIVYPSQPEKGKDSCNFGIHSIGFDCNGASSTKPVASPSTSYVASTPSSPATLSATSPSVPATTAETTTYGGSTSPSVPSSSSVATTPASTPVTSTAVVSTGSSTLPVETTSFSVTSYITTSTVFSTSVSTITSCAPEITNCPASSTAVVTVTIPVSTTVCPVTETLSYPATSPVTETAPVGTETATVGTETATIGTETATVGTETATIGTESATSPATYPTTAPVASSATSPVGTTSSSPAVPVETLPCPSVVPSCLNTWKFSTGCKDNTDSSCYCPDNTFVQNVFACLAAHGESDEVVSEAISYFQGICAPFIPSNPGIATGAETYTTVLTATATAAPTAVTTIMVTATTVVPCTNSEGLTIPSSSSTVTISTTMTAPQVIFTTYPASAGAQTSDVAVVPGTYSYTAPLATATATGVSPPYPTGSAGAITTLSTSTGALPTGTALPTSSIVQAGAPRVGSGIGLLGAMAVAVAVL
ncbi:hypothetical protein F5Y15DRAFT_369246 [Xylariaceae sp. FL0016]|nr:hypothetical protein F5Y15DRAFT_369246 [Xylariaceae sp. FL0016]